MEVTHVVPLPPPLPDHNRYSAILNVQGLPSVLHNTDDEIKAFEEMLVKASIAFLSEMKSSHIDLKAAKEHCFKIQLLTAWHTIAKGVEVLKTEIHKLTTMKPNSLQQRIMLIRINLALHDAYELFHLLHGYVRILSKIDPKEEAIEELALYIRSKCLSFDNESRLLIQSLELQSLDTTSIHKALELVRHNYSHVVAHKTLFTTAIAKASSLQGLRKLVSWLSKMIPRAVSLASGNYLPTLVDILRGLPLFIGHLIHTGNHHKAADVIYRQKAIEKASLSDLTLDKVQSNEQAHDRF